MTTRLDKIDIEDILFFDIEVARKTKNLKIGSREFELYKHKIRDRKTDTYPTDKEVIETYEKRAALTMTYTKIVSIGVGYVKSGVVSIKAVSGHNEEELLKEFAKISTKFMFVCGANILGYDLPMISVNSSKYFRVQDHLPDKFITGGKKPWNLDSVIDLMDIFKGTHYSNTSLDEMCYHFGLPSSKDEISGSEVSEEYWKNGLENIDKYVKKDVLANINIFRSMRGEEPFETFKDKTGTKVTADPLITKIWKSKKITKTDGKKLDAFCKDLTDSEIKSVRDILKAALIDDKGNIPEEYEEFIGEL